MNQMTSPIHSDQTLADTTAVHVDMARADVVRNIGNIKNDGARLTAYLFARLAARNEDETNIADEGINRCIAPLTLALEALLDPTPLDGMDPDALRWMRNELHNDETCLTGVKALNGHLRKFIDSVSANQNVSVDDIFASLNVVKNQFIPPFEAFIGHLKSQIQTQRDERVSGIQDGTSRAKRGVERIDEIARTVRMVSINAQIEAARAGEHGRAFSIIAQEINALSDEISSVGQDVQDGLEETLRRT